MRNADLDGARPRAPDLARRHVAQHAPANAPAPRSPDSKFPIACNRQLDASLSRPQCVRSPEPGVAELSSRRPTPASASPASCQWHSQWQVQLLIPRIGPPAGVDHASAHLWPAAQLRSKCTAQRAHCR